MTRIAQNEISQYLGIEVQYVDTESSKASARTKQSRMTVQPKQIAKSFGIN